MHTETSRITKRDILLIFFKRKRTVIGFFLSTVLLVALGVYILPLPHKAVASVYVNRVMPATPIASRENMPLSHYLDRHEVMNTEQEIISSRSVMERTVDTLGLDKLESKPSEYEFINTLDSYKTRVKKWFGEVGLLPVLDKREGYIIWLQKNIKVKSDLDSDIITISYFSVDDPVLLARIVNGVLQSYLEKRLELARNTDLVNFYYAQAENSKNILEKLQKESIQYKKQRHIGSIKEQKTSVTKKKAYLEKQLQGVEAELGKVKSRLQKLTLADGAATYVPFKESDGSYKLIDEMGLRLLNMKMDIFKLIQTYGENDLKVTEKKSEIQQLVQRVIHSLSALQESLQAEKTLLSEQIDSANEQIVALNDDEAKIREFDLGIAAAEKNYWLYKDNIEQTKMAGKTDISLLNVKVVDYAAVPSKPVLSRLMFIIIAGVLGLILGVGLALVVEYFDHSINSESDAAYYLGAKVLATFPDVGDK